MRPSSAGPASTKPAASRGPRLRLATGRAVTAAGSCFGSIAMGCRGAPEHEFHRVVPELRELREVAQFFERTVPISSMDAAHDVANAVRFVLWTKAVPSLLTATSRHRFPISIYSRAGEAERQSWQHRPLFMVGRGEAK